MSSELSRGGSNSSSEMPLSFAGNMPVVVVVEPSGFVFVVVVVVVSLVFIVVPTSMSGRIGPPW